MRSRFRTSLVAVIAVFALSALTSTAAQATEGPFFKVGGTRLKAGESKELKTKLAYFITKDTEGIKYRCNNETLEAGADILGPKAGSAGIAQETIVFSGCSVEGDGGGCTVENKQIKTTALDQYAAYETEARTGKLFMLLKPASKETIATIKLVGTCTHGNTMYLEGSVASGVFSGGKAVEAGKEPAEAVVNVMEFRPRSVVWIEKGGIVELWHPALKESPTLSPVAIEGKSEWTLAGEPSWGIFTK